MSVFMRFWVEIRVYLAAASMILAVWLWLLYCVENCQSIEEIAEGPANYEPAYPLLSHKLLQIEADRRRIKNEALVNQAHYVTDWIVEKSKSLPKLPGTPTREEVIAFFAHINRLIDEYFIYKASTLFSEGLVLQGIDCDLRTYLFYDISKAAGLDHVSVVYSPGHAFIGWRAPNSESPIFWETTAGEQADLSDPIYRQANDNYYYQMLPTDHVETTWTIYNASSAFWEGIDVEENIAYIKKIADQYPDNAYYQVIRIGAELKAKDKIEEADVIRLKQVLKMSPNDIQANWYLMYHYLETGQMDLAKERLDAVPPSRRTPDMLEKYAAKLRWWMPTEHFWKLYAWGFSFYSVLMEYNGTRSDLTSYWVFLIFNAYAFLGVFLYRLKNGHYKFPPCERIFASWGRPANSVDLSQNSDSAMRRITKRGLRLS